MKKCTLILSKLIFLFLFCGCSSSDDDKKYFTLNINGVDYRYAVTASYHNGSTPEDDNKYVEIYGYSSETDKYSACMIGFSYKVEGGGTYTLTDYATMNEDVAEETKNKYLYIHVNLGNDENEVAADQNIVRYGTNNNSGTMEVRVTGIEYQFKIDRPYTLTDAGQSSGTPPENAPSSIILSTKEDYM